MKLDAKQLRITKPTEEQLANIKRRPLWIIADNVLDTYNIGGLFRLADAVGAAELILCGGSEAPPSSRIHKAAVGTEEWVKWRYFASAGQAIGKLREEVLGIKIAAVEQDERSTPILNAEFKISDDQPVALVVGHETEGVSRETLDLTDTIVEIPMWGVNKSLNVIVSAAIAVYGMLKT